MMTCEQAIHLLLEFLEETLSPEVRRAVESHLRHCDACPDFVESYHKAAVLCRKTLMKNAPPEFGDRLMEFLRENTGNAKD